MTQTYLSVTDVEYCPRFVPPKDFSSQELLTCGLSGLSDFFTSEDYYLIQTLITQVEHKSW